MNPEVGKAVLAVRSALRAVWPVVVSWAVLVQTGVVPREKLFSVDALLALIVGIGAKGVSTVATAKSVTVKERIP